MKVFEAVLRIKGKPEEPDLQRAKAKAALRPRVAGTDYHSDRIRKRQ